MAIKKITISDVTKKHLRIIAYLVISAVLAYAIGLLADRPELLLLSPVINYVIYAVKNELNKEGYIEVLRK